VEELSRVEHHLLEAKARAARMDKQLNEQVSSNYPAYNDVLFPHKRASINQFLDEQLLDQHDLLLPSKYMVNPVSPQSPPTGNFFEDVKTEWSNLIGQFQVPYFTYSPPKLHKKVIGSSVSHKNHLLLFESVTLLLPWGYSTTACRLKTSSY